MYYPNEREEYDVYLGKWPHDHYPAGDIVELILKKTPYKKLVITETDIELGEPTAETKDGVNYRFVMPDRDVHIDYEYQQIYLKCPACGKEYALGENLCPHCQAPLHENAGEVKSWRDMLSDGILAWGVDVGRFVFEKYGKVVYALTDTPHVGASDVVMCYQISPIVYKRLLKMSKRGGIPQPPVSKALTDQYHDLFLCSQSAYAIRYEFTLRDVDLSLCDDL